MAEGVSADLEAALELLMRVRPRDDVQHPPFLTKWKADLDAFTAALAIRAGREDTA